MEYRIEKENSPACAIARCGRTVDAIEDFANRQGKSRVWHRGLYVKRRVAAALIEAFQIPIVELLAVLSNNGSFVSNPETSYFWPKCSLAYCSHAYVNVNIRVPIWICLGQPTFAGFPTFLPISFHLLFSYSLIAFARATLCQSVSDWYLMAMLRSILHPQRTPHNAYPLTG